MSKFLATHVLECNGRRVPVLATTDHPASSYGRAVWVDADGVAYTEVGLEDRAGMNVKPITQGDK